MPSKQKNDPLAEIEQTQAELKKSIDKSRELAEKSQRLLDRHRKDITKEE